MTEVVRERHGGGGALQRLMRFLFLTPTLGILLMLAMVVGGLLAYSNLVKESMPDLEIPQAMVTTLWVGADPESIEQSVTRELEEELRGLSGLKSINSASYDSYSIVAVEFQADTSIEESMQLLRSAVDDAAARLPEDVEKPKIEQMSVDDRPILTIVLKGNSNPAQLASTAQELQDRLEILAGVNEVELGGLRDEIVAVRLLPERLLELGLSPSEIFTVIQQANIDTPWGDLQDPGLMANIRLSGRFRSIEDLRNLPISRIESGLSQRITRLADVADVTIALEPEETRGFFRSGDSDFEAAIELSVKKVPGADTIAIIAAVSDAMTSSEYADFWPAGISYEITQSQSEQIWDALINVFNNGWQAMLAVFLILLVLLTWREGLVAGLCIPITFLGALILIWALGYTLNELVIIGMVLALGLMVDVFILMMEGLHEGIYVEKKSFDEAALATIRRYALPAAAGQITTVLALAPLMAISGVSGKFIRVLPVTAICCLVVAFLVALLVAVPLSRGVFRGAGKKNAGENAASAVENVPHSTADRVTAKASAWLREWSTTNTLKSRRTAWITLGVSAMLFVLGVGLMATVPVTMYNNTDGRKIGINIELSPSATLDQSQQLADRVGELLGEKDYIESVFKLVGKKSPFAGGSITDALTASLAKNYVGFSIMLRPEEERDRPGYELADELRAQIGALLEDNFAATRLLVVAETGQPTAGDPIQIELTGSSMDTLAEISRELQTLLRQASGTADVRDSIGDTRVSIDLIPNREAMDFYGIDQQTLASQVRYAMSDVKIGEFDQPGLEDALDIRMGIGWPSRNYQLGGPRSSSELEMIRVYTPAGEAVPLVSLVNPRIDAQALTLLHTGGKRAVTVMAKNEGRAVSEILDDIQPKLEAASGDWPGGYAFTIKGEAEEAAETFSSAGTMLVLAIMLVFAVLVLVFGSFSQSLIILITIPLALIGTFLGFGLLQIPFSFFAMVGVVALIGIVANDAIVMVDVMNSYIKAGKSVQEAAAHGAGDRLRPIIGTSVTTIAGLIPLAISNPMWRPLCFAVIFGLIASTVLTLVVVPALFMLFTKTRESVGASESTIRS